MAPPPASPPPAAAGPRWWGTLLYVPLLYGIGWLVVRPLGLLAPGLRVDQLDLLGVGVAFALLLLTLPRRLRRVWGEPRPWRRLGLAGPPGAALGAWLGGLGQALLGESLVLAQCNQTCGEAHGHGPGEDGVHDANPPFLGALDEVYHTIL